MGFGDGKLLKGYGAGVTIAVVVIIVVRVIVVETIIIITVIKVPIAVQGLSGQRGCMQCSSSTARLTHVVQWTAAWDKGYRMIK